MSALKWTTIVRVVGAVVAGALPVVIAWTVFVMASGR